MRQLASVQKILSVEPIEGADQIVKAKVLGWDVVVKKAEFSVGDLVVYCEIDSILPDRAEFEFMRDRKMRVRTIRLKGQISQGICFPLSVLPPETKVCEGMDCTDLLGVTKYEPQLPAVLSGQAKGDFPYFIPKTDETRVQVLQDLLTKYKGTKCYKTEKIDGSSVTYYLKDGNFGVCSRNLELKEPQESDLTYIDSEGNVLPRKPNAYWKIANDFNVKTKLETMAASIGYPNIALQGEVYGEGIQGNKLKVNGITVAFFNAYDIDGKRYLSYNELKLLLAFLDLPMVPVIDDEYELGDDIEELVRQATRRSVINPSVWVEGDVIRPLDETTEIGNCGKWTYGGRFSFKVINPEFLLGFKE